MSYAVNQEMCDTYKGLAKPGPMVYKRKWLGMGPVMKPDLRCGKSQAIAGERRLSGVQEPGIQATPRLALG
jgi:hypothetical protein